MSEQPKIPPEIVELESKLYRLVVARTSHVEAINKINEVIKAWESELNKMYEKIPSESRPRQDSL